MSRTIGMSRNIKLEWLNRVAELYIMGRTESEIRKELNEYLAFEIKSPTNLRRTRGILMNIWTRDRDDTGQSKKVAVELYKTDDKEKQLLAHWCLMLLAYPVFADICSTIGKIDRKMFDINIKEIRDKMFDLWGERSTLYYSIEKNVQTLKDIGVLHSLPKYQYGINRYSIDDKCGPILISNTLLVLREKLYLSLGELNNSPEFFPFNYNISADGLGESDMFYVDRFGGELVVGR
jgi:hypothetical protein